MNIPLFVSYKGKHKGKARNAETFSNWKDRKCWKVRKTHELILRINMKLLTDTDKISEYAVAIGEPVTCLEQPVFSNVLECNTVWKILQAYVSEEEQGLLWIWTENIYTGNTLIMKNTGYYHILAEVFREMLHNLGDNQRLWRLCDSPHNLPTLLVECKKPKKAIKSIT